MAGGLHWEGRVLAGGVGGETEVPAGGSCWARAGVTWGCCHIGGPGLLCVLLLHLVRSSSMSSACFTGRLAAC
jgi:hypothetical protein